MRTDTLFDRYYFARAGYTDGTGDFHAMCQTAILKGGRILEVGAGPSNATTRALAEHGTVIGVDVSDEVLGNDGLAEASVYDGGRLPFPAASFDGVVSNYVLEHIAPPMPHFAEVARVLKPGASYVFRTPNLLHYVALASYLTPHRLHVSLSKRLRGMGTADHDPWPTHYAANLPLRIRLVAKATGLDVVELRMVEKEPSYGRVGAWAFYPMMWYERLVNATRLGAPFRANIFGVLRKSMAHR
jgi:SAM-dependent methyltransferase